MQYNGEKNFIEMLTVDSSNQNLTVFDVGANKGEYSQLLIDAAKQNNVLLSLHAFEPVATYIPPEGILNKVAVSDRVETVTLYMRANDEISSMYRMAYLDRKYGEIEAVTVPTIRLDEYIKKNQIKHIDLLKIDVEGHELAALRGVGEFLRPDFISFVQFEYGGAFVESQTRLSDVYELLNGYIIYKIFPSYLEETPYDSILENYQYANFVACRI